MVFINGENSKIYGVFYAQLTEFRRYIRCKYPGLCKFPIYLLYIPYIYIYTIYLLFFKAYNNSKIRI